MGKAPPPSNLTIPFNKEDLFYALLRLFQMINDVDPLNDLSVVVFEEDQETAEEGGGEPEAPPPPNYFQKLHADQNAFLVSAMNEYIGLFALLSRPLYADPKLKKEFIAYAHERGEDIEFTYDKKPTGAPKLFIVPPQKDDKSDKGKKPPKK